MDPGVIEGRRRPGYVEPLPPPVTQDNPGAVRAPPPSAFPTDQIPVPDRWRLIQSLGLVTEQGLDVHLGLLHVRWPAGARHGCPPG